MTRPFPSSLCHSCQGVRYTENQRGSLFLMCLLTPRRYAPQPMLCCPHRQEFERWRLTIITRENLLIPTTFWTRTSAFSAISLPSAGEEVARWEHLTSNKQAGSLNFKQVSGVLLIEESGGADRRAHAPQQSEAILTPGWSLSYTSAQQVTLSLIPQRSVSLGWVDLSRPSREFEGVMSAIAQRDYGVIRQLSLSRPSL